jgi:hypothetical protein
MDFEGVKAWLTQQTEKQAKVCRLKATMGFVFAPLAVAVATTCVYWLLRLFTHDRRYNLGDSTKCLSISLAIIPLMFIGNRLTPRRDLMEERMSGDSVDAGLARYRKGEVLGLLFLWILFTGPRLVDWGIASLREGRRWQHQDVHSSAAVLWLLASRLKKVPYEDFAREIPWLNLDDILPELMRIPGVLKLKGPPAGLALTDDLRKAIGTGGQLEF